MMKSVFVRAVLSCIAFLLPIGAMAQYEEPMEEEYGSESPPPPKGVGDADPGKVFPEPEPPLRGGPPPKTHVADDPEELAAINSPDKFIGLKEMASEIAGAQHAVTDDPKSDALKNLVGRSWQIVYKGKIPKGYKIEWVVSPSPPLAVKHLDVADNKRPSVTVTLTSLEGLFLEVGFMKRIVVKVLAAYDASQGEDEGEGTGTNKLIVNFHTNTVLISDKAQGRSGKPLFKYRKCPGSESHITWDPENALEPIDLVSYPGAFVFLRKTEYIASDIHLKLCFVSLEDGKERVAKTVIPGLKTKECKWRIDAAFSYPFGFSLGAYELFADRRFVSGFGPTASILKTDRDATLGRADIVLYGPEISGELLAWTVLVVSPNLFVSSHYGGVGFSAGSMLSMKLGIMHPFVGLWADYNALTVWDSESYEKRNFSLFGRLGVGFGK